MKRYAESERLRRQLFHPERKEEERMSETETTTKAPDGTEVQTKPAPQQEPEPKQPEDPNSGNNAPQAPDKQGDK